MQRYKNRTKRDGGINSVIPYIHILEYFICKKKLKLRGQFANKMFQTKTYLHGIE